MPSGSAQSPVPTYNDEVPLVRHIFRLGLSIVLVFVSYLLSG